MTPIEALRRLQPEAPPVPVRLCAGCTQALLAQLRSLFPPRQEGEWSTLEGSQVMGCTFVDAPVDQCALHALLHEEAPCPR